MSNRTASTAEKDASSVRLPHARRGYKQSDLGDIPVDWEIKPLKRISPKQSVGLVINPSSHFVESGSVPMLVGSNVAENCISWESASRISESTNQLLPASRLWAGDLVTVRVGEPGSTAVVPPELNGCNCASMMIVRRHPSFDSRWLCLVMNSWIGRNQVAHVQYGTAQKQFNISHAINFRFAVPPLPEQRAMAQALNDVHALLGALHRLIAKKRDLKQAAMQQLLTGQTRLPGFGSKWAVKPLGDVSWFQEGPGVRSTQFTTSGVKLLNGTNILRGALNLETTSRFISEREAKGAYSHFLADQGDIVLASSGITIDRLHEKVAFVRALDLPFCMNTSTIRFKPFPDLLDPGFLFQFLTSDGFKRPIGAQATGSAQLNFGPSHVAKIDIPVPDLSEQRAIAVALRDIDADLVALEQRCDKTHAIKQGMMQELLTGRIRLV